MHGDPTDPRSTFSGSAGRYLTSGDHQSGPDLQKIHQVARKHLPEITVDVATGAGHALRAACPYSSFGVATDLTLEMLKVARDHLTGAGFDNVSYVQSKADRLPLEESSVSLLTCRIAPHHFPSVQRFLQEVARVLKPDGKCVIIDSVVPEEGAFDRFINEVEQSRDPSHVRSHTIRQWLGYFDRCGLKVATFELFEREHPFGEWAERTGLAGEEVQALEDRFRRAPLTIRERFKVRLDEKGKVISYTDEKGIFVGTK